MFLSFANSYWIYWFYLVWMIYTLTVALDSPFINLIIENKKISYFLAWGNFLFIGRNLKFFLNKKNRIFFKNKKNQIFDVLKSLKRNSDNFSIILLWPTIQLSVCESFTWNKIELNTNNIYNFDLNSFHFILYKIWHWSVQIHT